MAIAAGLLSPPDYITGDAVLAADVVGTPEAFDNVDTRVEGGSTGYQIIFRMDPTKYANPIRWTATNESDRDTTLASVIDILQEQVPAES